MDDLPNGFTGFSAQHQARQRQQRFAACPDPAAEKLDFDPEKLATLTGEERRHAWVEIDLGAVRENIIEIRKRVSGRSRIMAVVKADAYGHGAVQVAKTALNSGAEYLGVASIDEAIELREALLNAPVLLLSEPPVSAIPLLLAYKVMPSVYSPEFAIQYAEMADAYGVRAPYHLVINTGMNRIGVEYSDAVEFLSLVSFHRALELEGTFTHYATADMQDELAFRMQTKRFVEAINALRMAGINPGIVHAANSAATIRYPEVHLDMVRVGIALYGLQPSRLTYPLIRLRPAMSVHARITDMRMPAMSEGVSYGHHYRSPGNVKICTIPLGYADGLRRGLSGRTDFITGGQRFRQVGAITMDQCMFEVDLRVSGTRVRPNPQIGDEVLVVGQAGEVAVTLDEMAYTLETINYELATGFSQRLPRIYRT